MLLAVDIGNTNTKFGVFDGPTLISKRSFRTSQPYEFEDLEVVGSVTAAIVCSVVPAATTTISRAVRSEFGIEPVVVTHDLDLGLDVRYEPPTELGLDRLINSFAASQIYGTPVIVCGFGTATTIDVVDENGVFLGGMISPGMHMMARSLNEHTARLPRVEPDKPASLLGTNTEGSIRSGIYFTQLAAVEGIISRIGKEIGGKARVVATGGLANTIAESTKVIDIVDGSLLLNGLRLIHERLYA